MTRKLKLMMLLVGLILSAVFALWYPYVSGSVPEWKIQIVNQSGQVIVGAQVNQEWIDPIDDGIVIGDSRTTDASGMVLFPRRILRNRLALGFAHAAPASRLFVCWEDQFGDLDWDGQPPRSATKLVLKKGACPYG
jgi:hypothetical protein